jgi:O-methyltransferase involved in polyketide biosynthesis
VEPEIAMGDVSATSLVTLYCRAIESRSENPVLYDPKSVEIAAELDPVLSRSKNPLERALAEGSLNPALVKQIARRAGRYDKYVVDFLEKSPGGVVVNIGCGLDSRFLRTDNGRMFFYDLDLPEVIDLRKRFFGETGRYRMIASSVLDYEWMSIVSAHKGPFMFMAEGVFMYLEAGDVKSLVLTLREEFPGSELVCEVFSSSWLKGLRGKMVGYKVGRQLHFGKDAAFRSGIRDSREMEGWHPGIRLLDEWSYFDSGEENCGWLRVFSRAGLLRHIQWTVHYLLGQADEGGR